MRDMFLESKKRILLVDGPSLLREAICNFLVQQKYQVEVADSGEQALQKLEQSDKYELVLAETHLPGMNGIEFAINLRKGFPFAKLALMSRSRVEDIFPAIRKLRIHCVITKTTPFDFDELRVAIDNQITPQNAFGLKRYLRNPMILQEIVVQTRNDRTKALDDALKFFRRYRKYDTDVTEIRLAFEELINNAVFHAFRRPGGAEKYRAGNFTMLDPDEEITVEYGRDKRFLGCSVTDNQGNLDVDTVLTKMERQISLEGLMDESGRGAYLTRTLCDRMILNVEPGRATQWILLFAHQPTLCAKPLYVNVLESVRV